MKIKLEGVFEHEDGDGIVKFIDNDNNNCFNLNSFPHDFSSAIYAVVFVFVPWYPVDGLILKYFETITPRYPQIDFHFAALGNEFRVNDFLQGVNKEYQKTPILLLYKNNEKVFEQVRILLKAEEQLEIILQQHFGLILGTNSLRFHKLTEKISNKTTEIKTLSTRRPLLVREKIELDFLQKILAADNLKLLQSLENEVNSTPTDPELIKQLQRLLSEKKAFY